MTQPVLVIGAGPVGLTLTSELARYGIPVRVVDKAAARTDKSKALILWSRTLELLDRGGPDGSAPFVAAGSRVEAINLVARERPIGRIGIGDVRSPYPYALMLPQADTERLLEERLAGQGISVERRVELASFIRRDDGVEAVLRHADGREELVSAGWLVGCDGAHSAVRHGLGAPFAGETLNSDWLLADVHMRGYPFLDSEAAVYWHRDGVFIVFPIAPGRYRLLADLPPSGAEHPPTPTLQEVQALMDQRGPSGMAAFDPIWLAGFRINGRKVASYRWGRVFLAGDAAHVHSPAGGQGMNTGMQDAMNLAWKLALVERGVCKDSLLDSYSPERSEVGDQVLKAAGRLTTVGTLKNPVAQGVRNIVGHVMLGLPRVTHAMADTMSEVAIGFKHSPLNGPGLHDGPRPGERVAPVAGQRPVGSGGAPLFILFAAPGPETEALTRRFAGLLDPEPRPPIRAGAIWLVRPDGYVAMAAAHGGWGEVGDYLDRLVSHSAPGEQAPSADQGRGVSEAISMGALEVRFLRSKDETAGSLGRVRDDHAAGRETVMSPPLEIVKKDRPKPTSVMPADEQRGGRRRSVTGKTSLVPAVLALALALTARGSARAAEDGVDPLAGLLARNTPVICRDQTYALCAGASCFVFNNVAYCGCGVLKGDSISSPFNYDDSNVCSVNAEGVNNGYVVSTFSLPESIVAPSGNQALYICPRTSRAAYAKCDGGICFTSTIGHSPPGSNTPLGNNQIVCSCPVNRANPIQGLEIIGPYPCQESFFQNCDRTVANNDTGSTLYDGTSIGSTVIGTRLLYGSVPPLNTCR